eukprot:362982-Chlamydomonas_euryale.AAC.13
MGAVLALLLCTACQGKSPCIRGGVRRQATPPPLASSLPCMSTSPAIPVLATDLGVALRILQQAQNELAALDRPAALARRLPLLLGLGRAASAACVAHERDAARLLQHSLQVLFGLRQGLATDGVGGLASVLVVHAKVRAARLRSRGAERRRRRRWLQ